MKISVITDIGPIKFEVVDGIMHGDGWESKFTPDKIRDYIFCYKKKLGPYLVRCLRIAYKHEIDWQIGDSMPDLLIDLLDFKCGDKVKTTKLIKTLYLHLPVGSIGKVVDWDDNGYDVMFDNFRLILPLEDLVEG